MSSLDNQCETRAHEIARAYLLGLGRVSVRVGARTFVLERVSVLPNLCIDDLN